MTEAQGTGAGDVLAMYLIAALVSKALSELI